jgi:hypothetical protein
MSPLFAQEVAWIKRTKLPGGKANDGEQWDEASAVPTAAAFAPGGSGEVQNGGDTVTTQPTLYGVDPGLGVTAYDAFIVNDLRYEVDGDPQVWPANPFSGWVPNDGATVVVALKKVTG